MGLVRKGSGDLELDNTITDFSGDKFKIGDIAEGESIVRQGDKMVGYTPGIAILPDVGTPGTHGGSGTIVESVTTDSKGRTVSITTIPTPSGGGGTISTDDPLPLGTADPGLGPEVSAWDHVHEHGDQAGGSLHDDVIPSGASGFMTGAQATQLVTNTSGISALQAIDLIAGDGLTGGGTLAADRTFNVGANGDGSIVVNPNDIQVSPTLQTAISTNTSNISTLSSTVSGLSSVYVPQTRTLTAGSGLTGTGDLSVNRTLAIGQNADNSITVNADDIQVSTTLQTAIVTNTSNIATLSGTVSGLSSVYTPQSRILTAGAGLTGTGDLSANRTFAIGANGDGSIVVNADDIQVSPTLQTSISTNTSDISTLSSTVSGLPSVYVPQTRTVTAGAGLTGTGDLSADLTLVIGQNADNSITVNANDIQLSAALQTAISTNTSDISSLSSTVAGLPSVYVPLARTITAGGGLTGTGDLTANRTLAIGQNADNSITVNADDIQVSTTLQTAISTNTSNISSLSSTVSGNSSAITTLQGRTLATTAPLQGGGTIGTTNLTLSIDAASGSTAGSLSIANFNKLLGLAALTTKGDLLGFDTGPVRVGVGTDGWVVTADTASTPGWKWAAPSGGGSGYSTIENPNGTPLTQRAIVSFTTEFLAADNVDTTDLSLAVNGVAFSKIAQGSARSVLGVTGNATADVASIQGTADQVLRVNTAGTALAFGTLAAGAFADTTIAGSKLSGFTNTSLPIANSSGQLTSSSLTFASNLLTHTASATTATVGILVENTGTAANGTRATIQLKNTSGSFVGNDPGVIITQGSQNYSMLIDGNGSGPNLMITPGTVATSSGFGIYMNTTGIVGCGAGVPSVVTGQVLQLNGSSVSLNGAVKNTSTSGYSAWQSEGASGAVVRMVGEGSASASTLYGLTRASLGYVDSTNRLAVGTINNHALSFITQSVERFQIDGSGVITITDAGNIVVGSTTGTKIGTAATQKIGLWNAAPVVQPASTGTTTAGFTANASANAVVAESTFTGNVGATAYTISDVVKNLKASGLLAQ